MLTMLRMGAEKPRVVELLQPVGKRSGHLCGQTYLSDLDLDRCVVLGGNESVSGRALSGDIDIHNISFVVLHLY